MPDPYRLLITGSRDWDNEAAITKPLTALLATTTFSGKTLILIHGAHPTGADAIANNWAEWHRHHGARIEIERHRADWRTHGLAAGPIRNREMVAAGADACLAYIGPCRKRSCGRPKPHGSHGAMDCADAAEAAGIPVRRWTA